MPNKPLVPYYGSIPTIATAYENDPRTRLANSLTAQGTSVAPVAQGGWAVPDGLARAAQALVGAFVQKGQQKKYGAREAVYTQDMARAAALASTPQPAPAPGMTTAAAALAPPSMPMRTIDPNTALGAPQIPPQAGNMPSPAMSPQPAANAAPRPVSGGFTAPPAMATPPMGARAGIGDMTPDYYRRGIRPIEGGTDPKTGAFRTSPKGAVGPGQIMPSTGPEAARLAGLPWDEKRFKSDTQYNDALGQAYYSEQLRTFGDPVKAAAAYNAGAGRVRRAIRRAGPGGDYTQHLPAETQDYVAKFTARVGDGTATDTGVPDGTNAGVTPLTQEAVPGLPQAQVERQNAPALPGEVHSNRLDMAQALMKSGNPDLMTIAQTYLDKGLDEQNSARTLSSQQQFAQGQTGYTSELADNNAARSDNRQAVIQDHRDANDRNFQREKTYVEQTYGAGQAQVGREFQHGERQAAQGFQSSERQAAQGFQTGERQATQQYNAGESALDRQNRLDVAGIRKDASGARQQQRNAYLNTPTGLKMQADSDKAIKDNNVAIGKFKRFMDLNGRQNTGGVALNTPGVAGVYRWSNSDLTEMNALANDTTLSAIGGSLGTAISDGDRKFISDSNINVTSPRTANVNVARARIGALQRDNDYHLEFGNAQADGTARQFHKEWAAFVNSTPIVTYDKNGNANASDNPITFEQWRNSRPKYDKNGKRVQ